MGSLFLVIFGILMYLLGYFVYAKYLAEKIFKLDDNNKTPAVEYRDGVDYVPTNKYILLGHHFTSIAGAGPIVGPAIALIWGWLPAILWVVLGAVFMGAVHDFGALVTSIRNKGQSIGTIIGYFVNERARLLFMFIILALAILVNAVFAFVIAKLLVSYPSVVLPAWIIIPIAIFFGYSVYKGKFNFLILSIFSVLLLYFTIFIGTYIPIDITPVANVLGMEPLMLWIIMLFIYTFFASSLPVWLLLQPRDFLNGIQLIIILILLYSGAVIGNPPVVLNAVNLSPEGAPSLFPFLFITIACGALSGFHSLVSSGTTSKQLSRERDARFVGYLGFLGESSLALAVIIACSAGFALTSPEKLQAIYSSWAQASSSANALSAVVEGGANLFTFLGIDRNIGIVMITTMIILFAATTMDTSVRIQRYIINELGNIYDINPLKNPWIASFIAVFTSMLLVLSKEGGKGGLIFWPVFGASNQLLAGLAFLVILLYLKKTGSKTTFILIPMIFVFITTTVALTMNAYSFFLKGDMLLVFTSLIILLLALWLIFESVLSLYRKNA